MSETGCTRVISHEELAASKLKEKYQDEFEIEGIVSQSVFEGYYTAIAYQVDNPDILFRVMIDNDGKGVSDNYVSRLLCREMSDRIAQNLNELEGIYCIHSVMLVAAWELTDSNMTLEQFLKHDPAMEFGIYLNYSPDHMDIDNFYNSLIHMFDGMESFSGSLFLYICDENMLKRIQDYLENNDKIYDSYMSMVSSYYLGSVEYIDGKISATKEEIAKMINDH